MNATRASLRGEAEPFSSLLIFAAALLFALGVKAFYATADADALGFVLGPTAALVGTLSGHRFEAEPGVGYLSRDLAFVIAPSCAGLNYLVIAFGTLVACFTCRIATPARRWGWLAAAAAIAYAATLLVNAVRIALALALREAALPLWLSAGQAHRIEGVVVYLGSLWLLALAVPVLLPARREPVARVGRWWTVAVSLALYLGVTLSIPFANGAWRDPGFLDHASTVLGVSGVLAIVALLVFGLAGAAVARARRRPEVASLAARASTGDALEPTPGLEPGTC